MAINPTIVIDTREQEPYVFEACATVRKSLPAGDYSLVGLEEQVAIERKSLQDLVNTIIRSRTRFYRELRVLASYEAACVVVEAGLVDLIQRRYRSDAHPNALIGTIMTIIQDFGVPVYFCSDRGSARYFVEQFLAGFHKRFK